MMVSIFSHKVEPNKMTDSVLIEEVEAAQGKLGILQLNAPKKLNSLNLDMIRTLARQLNDWKDQQDIAAVVLKSTRERAFCAGADIQALYKSATETPGGPCEYGETFFLEEYALDYLIHHYPKPIVCIGQGIVMGGGLGLMAGASHRIVTEQSKVAMPEITIGLFPDVGGSYFLNRIHYNIGFFLGLTGIPINATDAMFCELADICIESTRLDSFEEQLRSSSWSDDSTENYQILDELCNTFATDTKELDKRLPSKIKRHLTTLESICEAHSLSELNKAIAELDTDDEWLMKAKETLAAGSPLSSVLIYEQLKRHKSSDLREVFLSEYQLATNIIRYPEFAEGVRALLIDKDKAPVWQFAHFSDVPSSLINRMFDRPWDNNPLRGKLE